MQILFRGYQERRKPICYCTKREVKKATVLFQILRQHNIIFNDIDVSSDQRATDALIKKSGQTGVPQTEINGEIIVGFNRTRINELLGIKG